ncbi:MAG: type II toxin-antitoxin system VapC family toxin, partial [Anaerolineae bacterium]|nr:type II toxin-antitoxin system VapC family toxin [Anaerolineae bacterium]
MSSLFLDSSALAKRYLPEVGTSWLWQRILLSDSIVVSRITSVEVMSAVTRRQREGALSSEVVTGITRLLNRHFQQKYLVIDINHQITRLAIQLLTMYPLRAYD